jgi:hypothetical protein
MTTVEVELDKFAYCRESILEELYRECDPKAVLGTDDFLSLPPTEGYLNNPERLARIAREKKEREEWELKQRQESLIEALSKAVLESSITNLNCEDEDDDDDEEIRTDDDAVDYTYTPFQKE